MIATMEAEVRYVQDGVRPGRMEVVCGCMFCGKTHELIRRLRRAEIAHKRIQVFKPIVDNRYDAEDVVTHDNSKLKAVPVPSADKILSLVHTTTEVVGIDEAQFFDSDLPNVCQQLVQDGRRVIVATLDMDSNNNPFGPAPIMMAQAEMVTKLSAICMKCGDAAYFTKRIGGGTDTVEVGGADKYEARCRRCYYL